jgi:hypothetical protein
MKDVIRYRLHKIEHQVKPVAIIGLIYPRQISVGDKLAEIGIAPNRAGPENIICKHTAVRVRRMFCIDLHHLRGV